MRRRRRRVALLLGAQGSALGSTTSRPVTSRPVTSPPAAGKLLWSAVPGRSLKAFASVQCATNTFTSTTDRTMGQVWRVVQPAHLERCEAIGPTVSPHSVYYLGWSSKFDITDSMSRYLFQLKCDPSTGTANHPIDLEVVNGKIELEEWSHQHRSTVLWSVPAVNNRWNTYALRISEGRSDGTIQFWFDGAPQKLSNGSSTFTGTTYDGTTSYLKWGLYHVSKGTAHAVAQHHQDGHQPGRRGRLTTKLSRSPAAEQAGCGAVAPRAVTAPRCVRRRTAAAPGSAPPRPRTPRRPRPCPAPAPGVPAAGAPPTCRAAAVIPYPRLVPVAVISR
ncbi:hypothetical protein GXW82_09245 [Streptacidiphilus sp. 4-A2]|nr:hypothetical protein [Streptacidiphilus sp. 4-A2]